MYLFSYHLLFHTPISPSYKYNCFLLSADGFGNAYQYYEMVRMGSIIHPVYDIRGDSIQKVTYLNYAWSKKEANSSTGTDVKICMIIACAQNSIPNASLNLNFYFYRTEK